ncbi:hypothetical protein JTB14_025824 [Gonioctena quinquepunctata]|nr:hypothetical protein JTB14_025824 [Gonioctena quinquepunctata]
MSRSRKSTAAEAKLKEKVYDRKRREKLENCPETLEKLREKERLKYLKKKEKGQVKSSEPGHGKGAPDGVGGTLKRSADQAVAEGKDVTDLNVLKNVLSSKCPSISIIVSTADINYTDNLIKKSKSISTFPGTQKISQFVFSNDVLEFRTLSCFDCVGKCQHFHLGYYKTFEVSDKDHLQYQRDVKEVKVESNVKISKITPSEKNTYGYKVGDHVLITWNNEVYPGKILSLSDDGALVRCIKKGSKCRKWPTVKDEELYAWPDVLRIIKPPKLLSRGCYFVKEADEKK